MVKIGRSGLRGMTDAQCRTHAPADAEVIQTLAGRNRWLYEMATGASVTSGETPYVPRNPQGTHGHDHSGPPFGACIPHPIFTWGGYPHLTSMLMDNGSTYWTPFVQAGGASGLKATWVADVWVRAHAPVANAPLSRGYLYALVSVGASHTLTAELWSADDVSDVTSADVALSSSASVQIVTWGAYWKLRPGRQKLYIRITSDNTTQAASICGLSACVTAPVSY